MISFTNFKVASQAGKEQKISNSGWIYRLQRQLSAIISWVIVTIFPWVRPNHLSVLNVVLVLLVFGLSLLMTASNASAVIIVQLGLLWVSSVFDKMDGELARHQSYFTQSGIYYDLLYHFFYPFVFCSSLGFFFFATSHSFPLLIGSILLALMVSVYRMTGKLRYHVRHKIALEHHEALLQDYRSPQSRPRLISRRWESWILGIYDKMWFGYLILVAISSLDLIWGLWCYRVYLLVSLLLVANWLLREFPHDSLFSKDELN